jgi:cobalamin biosynthesis protein CobT
MPLGYSVPQRKATDNPEIMAVAYYVLHERFLPLIAQRRPDLTKRIQQELSEERSGLQIICRAVARRLEVVVQNDRDQFQNLNRLATETLHELREQLDANPAQRALAEPWFAHERSVLTQLVQDMALAILDVSLRPKQNSVATAAHPGNQQQHRGRQSRIAEEEEEPAQDDDEQEDGEEQDDEEEQDDDDEQNDEEEQDDGEEQDDNEEQSDDEDENDDDEDYDDDEEEDEDDY